MKLLIAGGGTGGHVFPALAIAREWMSRGSERDVVLVGTQRGIEMKLVPQAGLPLDSGETTTTPDPKLVAVGTDDQDKVLDLANLLLRAYTHEQINATVEANKAWIASGVWPMGLTMSAYITSKVTRINTDATAYITGSIWAGTVNPISNAPRVKMRDLVTPVDEQGRPNPGGDFKRAGAVEGHGPDLDQRAAVQG